MALDRFYFKSFTYPSFEFQRNWWVPAVDVGPGVQPVSLLTAPWRQNLFAAGLAAWVGTSSLALKAASQTTSLAEFQVSCLITELE